MDEEEYDQHGYSLEKISQHTGISIPKCLHILDALIKQKQVEKKSYFGGITGDRYRLKDQGRTLLFDGGFV